MIKVLRMNEINNMKDYMIITPSYMEIFCKKKYIKENYSIVNFKKFILDKYNGNKKLVNNSISYIIMHDAFNNVKDDLKYYNSVSNNIINNLVNTYDNFYDYDLINNDKINDLVKIFNEYERILNKNNYASMHMIYEHILENTLLDDKYLFLNFNNFNSDELKIIKKSSIDGEVLLVLDDINNEALNNILDINIDILKKDFNNKKVEFKALNDISDEVSFINNDITNKIINGYSYSDILLVAPNIKTYKPYFDMYLRHPHTSNDVTGLLTSRFIKLFCDILSGDFSCSKFIEILKLGLFEIDLKMVDKLDNYIYSWNLEDENFYTRFKYNPNGNKNHFSNNDENDLKDINDAKDSIIMPLKYLLENIIGVDNKTDILKIIYTYLLEEGIIKRLFSKDEEGVNKLISFLENINDYLDDSVTLEDILTVLSNIDLTSNKKVDMQNSINVCNLKDAIYENKKIIYLIGMTNSSIPYELSLPSLLSIDDISKEDLLSKIENNKLYCYHLFSKAILNDNVVITYPKLGSDLRLEEKNNYLEKLDLQSIDDYEINDKTEILKRYANLLSEDKTDKIDIDYLEKINLSNTHNLNYKLDKDVTNKLYGNTLSISPSSIETYAKCPFYYFCQYGLKLKVKEKYTFDNREVGTFIHYVLENIIKNDINDININNLYDYVLKYSKEYLTDNGKISNNTTNYVIETLSKNVTIVIKNIIDEMDVTKFRPSYFEFKISDDGVIKPLEIKLDSNTLKVNGIIDRVDTYEDHDNFYYRIIDYKTGDKKFRLDDTLDGLNLQMVIYLLAIKESNISNLNIIPSALLYYPALLKEKTSSRDSSIEDKNLIIRERLKMNGIVNKDDLSLLEENDNGSFIKITSRNNIDEQKVYGLDDLYLLFENVKETLRKIGNEIYEGNISVNPIGGRNDACIYCKYKSICKFDNKYDKKRKPLDYKNQEVFRMLGGDNNA